MRRAWIRMAALAAVVALGGGSRPALAGASFDFLFSMDRVGNDNQYFLNLAVSNYGYDRAVLEPVLPRLRYVEADLPVVLFLAHASGRSVQVIVDLRAGGLSWSVVFTRLHVPFDLLFAGIDRDPGPPYGKAWGYWRKNPRAVQLTDGDVRGLAQVQVGARTAGLSPFDLARGKGQGKAVAVMVAEKKNRPYDKGRPEQAGGPPPGKGKPKGKPQGGHGHP